MKKVMLLALVLLLAFLPYDNESDKDVNAQLGNTAGNIGKGGFVTEDENYCYYSELSGDYAIYRTSKDFKETEKIVGGRFGFAELNVCGDYIYYTDGRPGVLQRMSLDGKRRHKLITLRMVGNVVISGNRIYYRLSGFNDDWGKLYSCNLDGRKKKFLAKQVAGFCVDGDTLYYTNLEDDHSLWSMDVSGENKRKLIDREVYDIIVDERYVYYTDWGSKSKLFRMEKETLRDECINEERCGGINLSGDWIYYSNLSDKNSLYRISKDGKLKEKLFDGNIASINIVADSVFFERIDKDFGWYRLDLNEKCVVKLAQS